MTKLADGGAVGVGLMAFFKTIPWPEIAGFLSAVYLFGRIMATAYRWVRKMLTRKQNGG